MYLSHLLMPRVVEGWVRIPKEITPQAILLRKPGEEKFLTAARLEKERQSEDGFSLYRWEVLMLPILDPHPGTGFEAALLDEKSAILYPLGYTFNKAQAAKKHELVRPSGLQPANRWFDHFPLKDSRCFPFRSAAIVDQEPRRTLKLSKLWTTPSDATLPTDSNQSSLCLAQYCSFKPLTLSIPLLMARPLDARDPVGAEGCGRAGAAYGMTTHSNSGTLNAVQSAFGVTASQVSTFVSSASSSANYPAALKVSSRPSNFADPDLLVQMNIIFGQIGYSYRI